MPRPGTPQDRQEKTIGWSFPQPSHHTPAKARGKDPALKAFSEHLLHLGRWITLGVSIPLIIYGSTLILRLMKRYPVIITFGAGLLGWVAGEMALSDPAISDWSQAVD